MTLPKHLADATLTGPFSETAFAPIAAHYGIAPHDVTMACLLLNVAAADARKEAERQSLDMPKARKQLSSIQKHAAALLSELDALHAETAQVINEAHTATGLVEEFESETHDADRAMALAQDNIAALFEGSSEGAAFLASCQDKLNDLHGLIEVASRMAGAGKTGRAKDARLDLLVAVIFQVYESFVGERFSLQWHDDGEPLSRAACFCVEAVRVAEPDAPLSLIETVSRRVRHSHIKVSDLDELPAFVSHLNKRSR